MWAINRRTIANPVGLDLLRSWKAEHAIDSDAWLLPSHLPLLRVKPHTTSLSPIPLPADVLVDALQQPPLRAVPFTSVPRHRQHRMLQQCAPPPSVHASLLPQLMTRTPQGTLSWREASLDEFLDASFFQSRPQERLLVATAVLLDEGLALPPLGELTLLNAQHTTNPFSVDPHLQHRSALTGKPLPDSVSSGLTTVMAQFGYTSLYWVESGKLGREGLPMAALSPPHPISTIERVEVVHVSQLTSEVQHRLLHSIPRYVLLKSMVGAFVLNDRRWHSSKMFGLLQPLRHADIPVLYSAQKTDTEPLLWVSNVRGKNYHGNKILRHRHVLKLFYNVAQLPLSPQDMERLASARIALEEE